MSLGVTFGDDNISPIKITITHFTETHKAKRACFILLYKPGPSCIRALYPQNWAISSSKVHVAGAMERVLSTNHQSTLQDKMFLSKLLGWRETPDRWRPPRHALSWNFLFCWKINIVKIHIFLFRFGRGKLKPVKYFWKRSGLSQLAFIEHIYMVSPMQL